MTKTKKSLLIVSILAMMLLIVVGSTLAYLTDKRSVANIMRIGADSDGKKSVNISLDEPHFRQQIDAARELMGDGDKDNAGKYTYDKTTGNTTDAELNNIMPGTSIKKDPTITNNGAGPVYIRFKLVDQKDVALTETMLKKLTNTNDNEANPGLALTINTVFILSTDGYYYYAHEDKPLALVDGDRCQLFVEKSSSTHVTMTVPVNWDYNDISLLGTTFNLKVIAEAVQTDGVSGIPWKGTETGAAITANAH